MSAVDECVVGQGGDLRQRLGHCHVISSHTSHFTHVIIKYTDPTVFPLSLCPREWWLTLVSVPLEELATPAHKQRVPRKQHGAQGRGPRRRHQEQQVAPTTISTQDGGGRGFRISRRRLHY